MCNVARIVNRRIGIQMQQEQFNQYIQWQPPAALSRIPRQLGFAANVNVLSQVVLSGSATTLSN